MTRPRTKHLGLGIPLSSCKHISLLEGRFVDPAVSLANQLMVDVAVIKIYVCEQSSESTPRPLVGIHFEPDAFVTEPLRDVVARLVTSGSQTVMSDLSIWNAFPFLGCVLDVYLRCVDAEKANSIR